MLPQAPSKLNELLVGRQIDQEFFHGLVLERDYFKEAADKHPSEPVRDSDLPAAPGHISNALPVDPRLKTATRMGGETILGVLLAKIVHTPSKRVFYIVRDTIDALYAESQDRLKYPQWLMDDPRKQNERAFRIYELVRPPKDRYDHSWAGELDNKTYDTLAYFLYQYRMS